jgi:acyl-[acyl-carrier-protein] desaturase
MQVDHQAVLPAEQRVHLDAIREVLTALEPTVVELIATHRRTSRRWLPHEVVPWGAGRDFGAEPWAPEQCRLAPEVAIAVETNLLTEDNLPYYHATIGRLCPPSPVWREWNNLWTAEEHRHGEALAAYVHLMRVVDPTALDQRRFDFIQHGFDRVFADPLDLFAYTSAQELATRVAHLRTGQRADEPVLTRLLTLIARDENFHYLFYRAVAKAALALAPELMLPALVRQLCGFSMPGQGMDRFELRQAMIADASIYGPREHREMVIAPVLAFLEVERLTGLSPAATRAQERLMRLDAVLARIVERFERRERRSDRGVPVMAAVVSGGVGDGVGGVSGVSGVELS